MKNGPLLLNNSTMFLPVSSLRRLSSCSALTCSKVYGSVAFWSLHIFTACFRSNTEVYRAFELWTSIHNFQAHQATVLVTVGSVKLNTAVFLGLRFDEFGVRKKDTAVISNNASTFQNKLLVWVIGWSYHDGSCFMNDNINVPNFS